MDSFDDFFCDTKLNEFQNKYKLSKKELCEFFFQLNEFAMRTHTIGNYMPCPDNTYNGKKGGGDGYVYFLGMVHHKFRRCLQNRMQGAEHYRHSILRRNLSRQFQYNHEYARRDSLP